MSYHADPGGIFASDVHRRVLGHLPVPDGEPMEAFDDTGTPKEQRRTSLFHRMIPDQSTDLADEDEVNDVLADLEADGYAKHLKDGWKMTQAGFDALTGPIAEDTSG